LTGLVAEGLDELDERINALKGLLDDFNEIRVVSLRRRVVVTSFGI